MLDSLLGSMDPPLSPDRAEVLRRFAAWMAKEGWTLAGHERVGPTLRLSFTDDSRRVLLSVEEMRGLLEALEQGRAVELPLVHEGV